jgi:RimJ/RimL family protein N-acetyltransferase
MPRKVITTTRLRLEAAELRHLDAMRLAVEASLPELRKWMAWAIDDSVESTRDFLESAARAWQEDTEWSFAITLRDEVIGTIGIDTYHALHASAQLGYWLASSHTGQGLKTEAASALVTFGFEDLRLQRLWLHAGIENIASQRVAREAWLPQGGRCS